MTSADLSGLNAGYVAQMFEAYLDAPASVPDEWRELFERRSGRVRRIAAGTGRAAPERRSERHDRSWRTCTASRRFAGRRPHRSWRPRPRRPGACASTRGGAPRPRQPRSTRSLLGGVAAAMALVKAYRMHGHLAARLDPLGSEPMGDPALDESRLVPVADAGAAGADPGLAAPPLRRGRHAARGAAAPARGLHRLDRLRDRAHLRPRRARLAAPGDRVGPLPPAARRPRSGARCSTASPRRRASSSTCAGRSSARSSSRSRASSRSCRCSTRRSRSRRRAARTRS